MHIPELMVHVLIEVRGCPDQGGPHLPHDGEGGGVVVEGAAGGDDDGAGHTQRVHHLHDLGRDVAQGAAVEHHLLPRTHWPAVRGGYRYRCI